MPFITVAPPPGVCRSGTAYQAKGRWWDMNLMRFAEGATFPVGGWQLRSSASAMSGAVRALLTWRDNSNSRWIAAGSSSHLYVQDEAGTNHDITPSGYTAGRDSATQNLGFGGGAYGAGYYGVPRANTSAYLPATVWSLDAWGQHLVGCADTDGKLYEWALDTATAAAAVTNAPTGNAGLVVTQDGFLFALAPGGDGRKVQWCDQQDDTVWTTADTNQAGDYELRTSGTLQCGKAVPGGALLFTDIDVWKAGYIGTPLVYGFERVGSGCGVISKGAVASKDSIAAWMGHGAFWLYDGQSVQPLACEARSWVFDNLNDSQRSKVTAVHNAAKGEVWWFFPSSSSTENDSYIAWAYRESQRLGRDIWMIGTLARTSGDASGIFDNPLMAGANGLLYEHETGLDYGGATPFITTGVIELGQGDYFMEVQRLVPDTTSDGDVSAIIYGSMWPDSDQTAYGPYSLTSPTDLLLQARELQIRFDIGASLAPNIGPLRIEAIQGDPI